ncbi:unnamed protein product, partial [Meganyctiphanes norvegica]
EIVVIVFKQRHLRMLPWNFVLGDKLPTFYDAAMQICGVSPTPGSKKRSSAVYAYALALQNMWISCFGEAYVVSRNTIISRLTTVLQSYNKKIRGTKRYGDKRMTSIGQTKSIRNLNREWRFELLMASAKKKRGKKSDFDGKIGNDLFDIGRDMHLLTGLEKIFYEDQCTLRERRISEEI